MFLLCLILIQTLSFSAQGVENSILNEIIIENNGTLPEPFPVLKQKIKDKLEEQYGMLVNVRETEFDGRSIDAKHDNRKFRRKVISFTIHTNSIPTTSGFSVKNMPILMLGYAPTANQVEAIVFNRDTAKYDFSVKHKYGPGAQANQQPEDKYFKQEQICTACHQARAPIFSRFPWAETPFDFDSQTFKSFILGDMEAVAENPTLFAFANGEDRMHSLRSSIIPSSNSRNHLGKSGIDALSIDTAVRNSNEFNQLSSICSSACKGNKKCERLLFALSVSKRKHTSDTINAMHEELLPMLQWNETNYAYASSVLPDRNPYKNEERDGSVTFDTDSSKVYNEQTSANPLELNREIIGLNNFTQDGKVIDNPGNPLSLRPLVQPITPAEFLDKLQGFGAMACYGLTDHEVISLQADLNTLQQFVEHGENQHLLASYQGRIALLQAWKNGQEGVVVCESCNKQSYTSALKAEDIQAMSDIFGIAKEIVRSESPQNYFQEFCTSCHSSGALKLPLNDVEAMKRYTSPRGSVRERLEREEMPFKGSQEAQKLTPEVRQQMIDMLE